MQEVIRWEKYVKKGEARKENSLQHTYKASLLGCIILDNELSYIPDIDAYLILKATVIHDLGEIATGDTVYIDKTEEKDKEERDFFQRLFSTLPKSIKQDLDLAYCLQHATDELKAKYYKEINLFEAIERFGYVVFAYREFKENPKGKKIFVQTMRNQHEHLIRLAHELPGFGAVFYTPEVQQDVEEFLKQYEGQFIEQKGE